MKTITLALLAAVGAPLAAAQDAPAVDWSRDAVAQARPYTRIDATPRGGRQVTERLHARVSEFFDFDSGSERVGVVLNVCVDSDDTCDRLYYDLPAGRFRFDRATRAVLLDGEPVQRFNGIFGWESWRSPRWRLKAREIRLGAWESGFEVYVESR